MNINARRTAVLVAAFGLLAAACGSDDETTDSTQPPGTTAASGPRPAPVAYALVDDLGWKPYPATYAILSDRVEDESACLSVLVPVLQQAWVDFLAAPQPVLDELLTVTKTYNNYWTLSPELNAAAIAKFESDGIGSNGPDSTYGNIDGARIEGLFDELKPILDGKAISLPSGYTAESSFTNDFIDADIGIGGTGKADTSGTEAVCPKNLVIQTDWWPEAEHGGTYQLIGPGGTADAKLFTYSGPIAAAYKVGGIETVEVRAGGDAIEFQPVQTVMKTDSDIYLGYINSDDVIATAGTVATTSVAATLERNPQMLMWDPTQTTIDPKDPTTFKTSGKRVLHFPGVTYIDWMIAKGYLDAGQSDPNYGGAPDQWISNGGDFIQQGFASNEVFKYENEIAWKK